MPGDRKDVQDAAPARDPNLSFSYGEAFEKLIADLSVVQRHDDEFTAEEFCTRIGKSKTQGGYVLLGLIREGRVERRRSGRVFFYRVVS